MFFENDNAHLQLKNKLVQLYLTNRVPHALLFSGNEGSGHFQLAMFFTKVLLCKEVDRGPCGHCSSCKKTIQRSFLFRAYYENQSYPLIQGY